MASAARILVVDDDRDVRESLHDVLEHRGYVVVQAVDGEDAIDKMRGATELPDLILLDLMMPRMNGREFREAMVSEGRFRGVPVLVISADVDVGTKAAAMGVDAYLVKPFALRELLELVRMLVGAKGP